MLFIQPYIGFITLAVGMMWPMGMLAAWCWYWGVGGPVGMLVVIGRITDNTCWMISVCISILMVRIASKKS